MSYYFINHYCKITANLPNLGNVVISGWITKANKFSILMLEENNNHIRISRKKHLTGSITVLLEQKPVPEVITVRKECVVGN